MGAFKANLEALRLAHKEKKKLRTLPILEISEVTGISRYTLTRWQKGEKLKTLDADVALTLMDYFGCELSDLVTIVENGGSHK